MCKALQKKMNERKNNRIWRRQIYLWSERRSSVWAESAESGSASSARQEPRGDWATYFSFAGFFCYADKRNRQNRVKGVERPLIFLHDPCEIGFKKCGAPFDLSPNLGKGLQRRQPLTTSPVTGRWQFLHKKSLDNAWYYPMINRWNYFWFF